jgi:hypothetical protein
MSIKLGNLEWDLTNQADDELLLLACADVESVDNGAKTTTSTATHVTVTITTVDVHHFERRKQQHPVRCERRDDNQVDVNEWQQLRSILIGERDNSEPQVSREILYETCMIMHECTTFNHSVIILQSSSGVQQSSLQRPKFRFKSVQNSKERCDKAGPSSSSSPRSSSSHSLMKGRMPPSPPKGFAHPKAMNEALRLTPSPSHVASMNSDSEWVMRVSAARKLCTW